MQYSMGLCCQQITGEALRRAHHRIPFGQKSLVASIDRSPPSNDTVWLVRGSILPITYFFLRLPWTVGERRWYFITILMPHEEINDFSRWHTCRECRDLGRAKPMAPRNLVAGTRRRVRRDVSTENMVHLAETAKLEQIG
jgi:hypothetical protein